MNTALKLSAYGAALALLLAGGWAAGTAVGPRASEAGTPVDGHADAHSGTVAEAAADSHAQPAGLASSSRGYTFVPASTTPTGGTFSFAVVGPDDAPVTRFDATHDKLLHLIVVRRDTTGFQHVHPEMAPDGTWTVPLTLTAGGSYRAFADFVPAGGEAMTLGVDLAVAGRFTPRTHAPSRICRVDGYTVELTGDLAPGGGSELVLTVRRDGRPVTDLQPYLGAYGHLVALREGDLAYLHVHPEGGPGTSPAGPRIEFHAEAPSAGTYRLFLDFAHGGAVHTAEFTVATSGSAAADGGH